MNDTFSIAVPISHPCAKYESISDLSQLNGSNLLMVDKFISGNAYDPFFKSILIALGMTSFGAECFVHNMDELLSQVARRTRDHHFTFLYNY